MTHQFFPLTPVEQTTAGIIAEWWASEGHAPTLVDIARELNIKSKSGAHRAVTKLHKKGWLIKRKKNHNHNIKLKPRAPAIIPNDFLFTITADGIDAIRHPDQKRTKSC